MKEKSESNQTPKFLTASEGISDSPNMHLPINVNVCSKATFSFVRENLTKLLRQMDYMREITLEIYVYLLTGGMVWCKMKIKS